MGVIEGQGSITLSSLGATSDSVLSELLIFHEKAENPDFYLKNQNF